MKRIYKKPESFELPTELQYIICESAIINDDWDGFVDGGKIEW